MTIYLDLVFLVNFFTDGALLLVTGWTRKSRIRPWRLAAASAVGALYVLLMLLPGSSPLFTFAAKFAVSGLMIGIAFGFGRPKAFISNLAAFYLVSFCAAGGIFALYYYFLPPTEVIRAVIYGVFEWSVGFWLIGFGLVAVLAFYLRVFRSTKQTEMLASHKAWVEIQVGEFRLSCSGLVDTGNQLYDPLTKTPVMITEANLWKELLPDVWLKRIRTSETDQIIAAMGGEEESFALQDRLRIVPYRGINRATQFMLAIKPDLVKLKLQEREWETTRVLIGFDGGTLSADGSYQAIIHPMLLQD